MIFQKDEERMLEGKKGEGTRIAMSILYKLGEVEGAEEMIKITQAHIDLCGSASMGKAGIDFVERLANWGTKVRVPTTLNTTSRDVQRGEQFKTPRWFEERNLRVEKAFLEMGAIPTWSCTPYQYGLIPRFGEQIAWAESNAIAFANSVIGALTNRYGDFADICAAVVGKVPKCGLHVADNRRGEICFRLEKVPLRLFTKTSFCGALGYLMGELVESRIPVIKGIPREISTDSLKSFSAAIATSGSVGLFHILGVTPEAKIDNKELFKNGRPAEVVDIILSELIRTYEKLSSAKTDKVDLVAVGCPHFSFNEAKNLAKLLKGRAIHKNTEFWLFTNRVVFSWLKETKLKDSLLASGIKIGTDTCALGIPFDNWGFSSMMTNSAKLAHYVSIMKKMDVIFGSLQKCVLSALEGHLIREESLWKD